MKPLSFLHGVGIALALSLVSSFLYTALAPLLPGGALLRLLIALSGLSYILYLLGHSAKRSGRVTAVLVWFAVAGASWFAAPPLAVYLLTHAGLIWLLRSLYFYSSACSALLDLGVSALGVAAAIWAMVWSGSLLLSVWCFFLIQSLFVAIPASIQRGSGKKRVKPDDDENFQHAHRAAEDALRRISNSPCDHRGLVK